MLDSKKNLQILSGLLFLVCAVLALVIIIGDKDNLNKIVHDSNNDYFFTNPILDCEEAKPSNDGSISRNEINDRVDSLKERYDISFISLYFRDLNNGPWLGINEKEEFIPASLLKVPLVISLFRYAQDNKDIFNKKIFLTKDYVDNSYPQNSGSALVQMKEGEEYSLLEVAERTLVYSDNLGVNLILDNVPPNYLEELYLTLGGDGISSNVRVKDYASFFRLLYNSSYLDRNLSEKLLSILSKTEYKDGIVAGIPKDIIVAHKFGEYTVDEAFDGGVSLLTTEAQLHDCGIVYLPERPYILCVMTRGKDIDSQEKAIAELSKMIYEEVK